MKILILALAAFAFVASPLALSLANEVMLAALGALALTILMGAAGLLSLGHAALLGAGAFTVGVLTQELGVPAVVTLPASVLVGAGLGLVAGLPSLRLRGIYLALSTLALHFAVLYVASEYQTRRQISTGIVVPDPVFGPISVGDQRAWFVLLGCVLLATGLLCRALLRSRTGRAWLALRERDVAASSVGVHVTGYKLAAFVISSALTSLAGALGAYYHHFVAADGYTFFLTVQYLAMVLVGGVTSIVGALAGAAFVVLLPQVVSAVMATIPVPQTLKLYSFALQYVLFGAILAAFILGEPGGLVALPRRFRRRTVRVIAPPKAAPRLAALLDIADLSVAYGQATALHGVSLHVQSGSIVALVGANGAGKTTVLRAIGGFLDSEPARIIGGDIQLDGRSIAGWSPERTARAGVVLVPERDKLFTTLTVEQNLAISRGNPDRAFELFPQLAQRRRVLSGYLSGGERQMLALACALQCAPRVLLVDELSLGLAPIVLERLLRTLADLRRQLGLTIVLVEQNATAALEVADYAYVLVNGRVAAHAPAVELAHDPRVQSLYLGGRDRLPLAG